MLPYAGVNRYADVYAEYLSEHMRMRGMRG